MYCFMFSAHKLVYLLLFFLFSIQVYEGAVYMCQGKTYVVEKLDLPNKVAFCDLSSMRNVYSIYKFDKSTYYKSLLTYVAFLSRLYPIVR